MKPNNLHISTSPRLIAILCALCLAAPLRETRAASTPTVPTLSELAESLSQLTTQNSQLSTSLAAYRAENTQLLEEMAALNVRFGVCSNAISMIESKCETDPTWRAAYHQGLAAQTICTNEFGIIYRVEGASFSGTFENGKIVSGTAKELSKEEADAQREALSSAQSAQ